MSNERELRELKIKYIELGAEIEKLKSEKTKIGYKNDPIFLLSFGEYEKIKDKILNRSSWWWLRSSGYDDWIVGVDPSKWVNSFGYNVTGQFAIRPALNIKNIECLKYKPIDGTDKIITCGVTWEKVTEDIFIAENPIGYEKFDDKSNNYETSYIRQWLLDWFEKRRDW